MAAWTKQQLDCLNEIGIPLWKLTQPPLQAGATETGVANEYFYRLGPWTFRFKEKLPVTGVGWLNDLAAQAGEQPVQTSRCERFVDGQPFLRGALDGTQKRELWRTLSDWLC